MRAHKKELAWFLKGSLIVALSICYFISAVRFEPRNDFRINIDLAKPNHIVSPMEVTYVGDMGEKGLRLPPKAGQGWRGKAGGEANYTFFAPEEGKYTLWTFCLWNDKCTNAVFAQIDDMPKTIVGNDPIYQQWHWVRGFRVKLNRGTHKLTFSNHSDHIAIQNAVLTRSSSLPPDATGPVFSNIFYDGFDGCDQGNFGMWKQLSGKWSVQDPNKEKRFSGNALIGDCNETALITVGNNSWTNYVLNGVMRTTFKESRRGTASICIGLQDSKTYYALTLNSSPSQNDTELMVIKRTPQKTDILHTDAIQWAHNQWNPFEITMSVDKIIIQNITKDSVIIETNEELSGGIGLAVSDGTTAFFDDIHVRCIQEE